MMGDFFMYLPSANPNFKNNTASEFHVRPQNPIQLQKGEWEMGLVEMHYPHSWNIIHNKQENPFLAGNNILLQMKKEKQIEGKTNVSSIQIKYWVPVGGYDTPHTLAQVINKTTSKWHKDNLQIMSSNFQTKKEDINHIDNYYKNNFKKNLLKNGGGFITFNYDSDIQRMTFTTHPSVRAVRFSPLLQYVLGFGGVQWIRDLPKGGVYKASYPADLSGGKNTFYVYCDALQPQIVGGTLAPILRTVAVEGKHGDYIQKNFENPHYVKLRKNNFDTLEIAIKTDTDEYVDFNFGKVLLKVHVRKAQRAFDF